LYDRRFDASTPAPMMSQQYAALWRLAPHRRDVLDSISGGYVISPEPLRAFAPLVTYRGAFVQRNRAAFPLAYFREASTHRVAQVSSLAFTPTSVFIDVDAPSDGDVVVTQQDAPGWSVTVDGNPANPHKTSVFRTVTVTRGRHGIKWIYRPLAFIIGAVLTLIALVRLLLSNIFVKRVMRKNFSSSHEDLRSNFREGEV
jgi:hypothetical protein